MYPFEMLSSEAAFWIALGSLIAFVVGVIALPILLARIPDHYFLTHDEPLEFWKETRPRLRLAILVVRNVFGVVLLLLGIIMLITPGQGLITILIGISLMTFPGKRELELWVLRRKGVLRTINWIRRKRGKRPLLVGSLSEHDLSGEL